MLKFCLCTAAMKLLSVIFLSGLALAYAVPVPETQDMSERNYTFVYHNTSKISGYDEVEKLDFVVSSVVGAEDDSGKEIADPLRAHLDELFENFLDSISEGKVIQKELLEKLKDVRVKMKENKVTFSMKNKELLDMIRNKGRDYFQKLQNKLFERSIGDDIKETLKNAFDKLLEKISEGVENGKEVSKNSIDRMKVYMDKLKDFGLDMRKQLKEHGNKLPEKAKEFYRKFLEKLDIRDNDVLFADDGDDTTSDIAKKLRESFDEVLGIIQVALSNGEALGEDLLKDLKDAQVKMKENKVTFSMKNKDLVQSIMVKGKDYIQKIVDRLIGDYQVEKGLKEDLIEAMKDAFDRIVDNVRKGFDYGIEITGGNVKKVDLRIVLKK